jgi:hypothetical protein
MNVGLKVAYLWHDIDALEERATAENAEFRGTAGAGTVVTIPEVGALYDTSFFQEAEP